MDHFSVKHALDTMSVLWDTREQDTIRARKRMEQIGVPIERVALSFGDYSVKCDILDLRDIVAIERKMDLSELAHCYCQDRKRFVREFERARQAGAKIYLLIEDGSWEDAYAGKYRSRMEPVALVASIQAWLARYNCQIIFCQQQTTGRLIHDILYRELKEALEKFDADSQTDYLKN